MLLLLAALVLTIESLSANVSNVSARTDVHAVAPVVVAPVVMSRKRNK